MSILITRRLLQKLLIGVLAVGLCLVVLSYAVPQETYQAVMSLAQPDREVPIYCVEKTGAEKEIAISFDATWGADYTADILDILDQYNIKTTFFLCGRWIKEYPDKTRIIADHGHEIGNHSLTHPHMAQISKAQIEREIMETHKLIKEVTGQESNLFRCPFGEYDNQVIRTCRELDYLVIQWDVDSLDWRAYADADFIFNRVTKRVKPGSIVLFHNNGAHTTEALPRIIEHLQKQGYKILPISELLLKDNWYIDKVSGMQKHRR